MKILRIVLLVLVVLVVAAWLWLRGPDIPYADLEAKYSGPGSGFVDLPGDIHLHYVADGDSSKPVVLLLHGFGDSFTTWEGWTPLLAKDHRVLRIDLPGHGLTRAPEGYHASAPGDVEVVEAFAAAQKLDKFALAGNSMGGGIAWLYAIAHPERLSALVLVDAAGWPLPPSKDLPIAFKLWFLTHIDNTPLIREGLRKDVYDPAKITDAFVARWAEFQRAPGHRAILMSGDFSALGTASDEKLAAIHVPTLVLHGEADGLIPLESGKKFAAAIPGAKLITYPDAGHLPQVEVPARSAADVIAFIDAAGTTH